MNPASENETDALRSEIDSTRRRMDNTMDELGDRLKGRHLLDEILGFLRGSDGKVSELRHKVSESASNAARSVVDGVKANPMPAILIGAGIAWMIYAHRKSNAESYQWEYDEAGASYDPDAGYDEPLEYPSTRAASEDEGDEGIGLAAVRDVGSHLGNEALGSSGNGGLREKVSEAKDEIKDKVAAAADGVREKTRNVGRRVREAGSRVQARTREVYVRARDRVATTADEHPLGLGLACLAGGIAVGLALPTPEKVNRMAGPTMDRLRQRTRAAGSEYLEKGKRVARAAGTALKDEAEQQGLTFRKNQQREGGMQSESSGSEQRQGAENSGSDPTAMGNPGGSAGAGGGAAANNPGRGI